MARPLRYLIAPALTVLIATWHLSLPDAKVFVADTHDDQSDAAPLLEGLGSLHHPVATQSNKAQRYFDQGLGLVYAFNHAEALRSFKEAARLDPGCPMAYWGQALALGPNINVAMSRAQATEAYAAIQRAHALKSQGTEKDVAYIEALATRYSKGNAVNREVLDIAYAEAMERLAKRYPDDPDAGALYAAALMETRPWDYWTKDGQARPATVKALSALETLLARYPEHPAANHYYIHLVEASPNPERALASAERLTTLMPGAGHITHMPAHIFFRVGRYVDASDVTERAIETDERYIREHRPQGIYPMYYLHNLRFLSASASMEGRSAVALTAARKAAAQMHGQFPGKEIQLQDFLVTPLYVLTRFGRWDEILREPPPGKGLMYARGFWHYARGVAFTARRDLAQAAQELTQLEALAAHPSLKEVQVARNEASDLLTLAVRVLNGELAAQRGDRAASIRLLEGAVRLQDELNYFEPPAWYYPVRHSLGAALLAAGRAVEGEAVYREDLKQYPENGWSLFGLWRSLRTQGTTRDAATIEKRFHKAWSRADVPSGF